MSTSDLIQPRHLARRAVIYVRQSTPNQVLNNHESRRLQYALKQRAEELGWPAHDVQMIDRDLGISATVEEGRKGFQQLIAEIALGKVGILISYEAQRLARNCTHWYQLLDLCGRVDCLIADRDGVYDAASVNGRLLLGLKGQISEWELHILRGRLTAGLLSKARRGELANRLPVGLVRLESGEVIKHPDQEVQQRLLLIFDTILAKRSLSRAVRFFCQQGLKIPRQDRMGDLCWERPNIARVHTTITNPAYAGAFAWGRSRSTIDDKTGKYRKKKLPLEQWQVCIRDKYPAYIPWETFERIQQILHRNYGHYRNNNPGIPREGRSLLQGLVHCGKCGHPMFMAYQHSATYVCNHLWHQHGDPVCQWLPAAPIDTRVVEWFFAALSNAEIDVAAGILDEADRQRDALLSSRRQEVERLRYQARLVERQYQHADPENRLVAAELERRWEVAMCELKEVTEKLAHEEQNVPCWAIPADLLDALRTVGPRLPELWDQGLFSSSQKKALLRCLVDKVVLHRVAGDQVRTRVVWRGGATTVDDVTVQVAKFARLSRGKEMKEIILRMARDGQTDQQITSYLTSQGFHSPRSGTVLQSTVKLLRLSHRILVIHRQSHPCHVPGYLTVPQLAQKLGVPRHWIHNHIRKGKIRVDKDASTGCYLFPDNPGKLREFRQFFSGQISEVGC